ncbi:MAG TPA: hypothetical protein VND94_09420 [Terriglobia bacterium]|nr:hypothetical protein [Terriglobia bacterium]
MQQQIGDLGLHEPAHRSEAVLSIGFEELGADFRFELLQCHGNSGNRSPQLLGGIFEAAGLGDGGEDPKVGKANRHKRDGFRNISEKLKYITNIQN